MCKEPKIAGGGGMDEPAGSGRAGASRQLDRPHCVFSDRRRRAAAPASYLDPVARRCLRRPANSLSLAAAAAI